MRSTVWILVALLSSSCVSNTGIGVLAGATIGSSIGGLIGGGKGALIGAAAGIISGGVIGAFIDEQDRKVIEKNSPRTLERMERKEPLTLNDVIKLSQGGVSDDSIIRYIGQTSSLYELTQAQIRRLHDSGVSQRVINYMMDSSRL